MTTGTTQTATPTPAPAPAADAPLTPDLQFLKDAGEDISEFMPKPAEASPSPKPAEGSEPSPTPAPKDDDAEPGEVRVGDDGRVRDAKGRFVPVKALHEERGRRQTAESELTKLREQLAVANTKLELVAKPPASAESAGAQQPKNPFEEADIDPNADLLGAVQQERRRNAWLREQQTKATEETRAELTEQGVTQAYRDDTQRFLVAKPDYPKAFEHVVRARAMELIAMGVTDQAALAKQIREDESAIVRQAIASGKSPAHVFYTLALAKGYQAPAANPNPTPAAPGAQSAPEKTTAQQIIENVQAGQEAGKTLTGAGGAAPGPTLDQILAMSADEIIAMQSTAQGRAQLVAVGYLPPQA